VILITPVICCVIASDITNRNHRVRSFIRPCPIISKAVLLIFAFSIGLVLDIITVPLIILIGIPLFIGIQIYNVFRVLRLRRERLR